MTRQRRYGEDTPFCSWLREQDDLDSVEYSFTAHDVDMMCHKYRTEVDSVGTRQVQLLMWVEIKTRGAMPDPNQKQTLFFSHQKLRSKSRLIDSKTGDKVSVWNFGYFVLSMPGIRPDDAESVRWGRFAEDGSLEMVEIDVQHLKDVLGFRLCPERLTRLELRRHHKNTPLLVLEKTPLGFEIEVPLVKRS